MKSDQAGQVVELPGDGHAQRGQADHGHQDEEGDQQRFFVELGALVGEEGTDEMEHKVTSGVKCGLKKKRTDPGRG